MAEIHFIEVFSGCGGMSTGIIRSGLNPLLLVDNNNDCVETLNPWRFEKLYFICEQICESFQNLGSIYTFLYYNIIAIFLYLYIIMN